MGVPVFLAKFSKKGCSLVCWIRPVATRLPAARSLALSAWAADTPRASAAADKANLMNFMEGSLRFSWRWEKSLDADQRADGLLPLGRAGRSDLVAGLRPHGEGHRA